MFDVIVSFSFSFVLFCDTVFHSFLVLVPVRSLVRARVFLFFYFFFVFFLAFLFLLSSSIHSTHKGF